MRSKDPKAKPKFEMRSEDAVKFNSWSKRVMKYVAPASHSDDRGKKVFRLPEPHVAATIDFQDVDKPAFGQVDTYGNRVSRYFVEDKKLIGLEEIGYQELVKLAESMQRIPVLSRYVSVGSMEEYVFEWLETSYLGRTKKDMVETVLKKLEESVRENEIWIPVPNVIISKSIRIGRIELRTVTKTLMDQWEADWNRHNIEDSKEIEQLFRKYRKRYQGRAAAFVKIVAEENRAEELAFSEAQRSISVLRYFDPALQDPNTTSYCGLDGRYLVPKTFSISTENVRRPKFHGGFHGTPPIPWILTPPYIATIRSNGLDILSRVLSSDDRTSFQEGVLNAILIYTRSALESEPVDKLIYILAALESILLRKRDRSISQNVRERMAMYIGDSLKDSKMLVSDFKKVYSLRSDFLHYGLKREEEEILRRFMGNTWLLFNNVLLDIDKYETKIKFIQELDDRRLTPK